MKYDKGLIFLLVVTEIIFCLFAIYESNTGDGGCIAGFDCKDVQSSIYGTFLGIKLTYLGLAAFAGLFIIYFLTYKKKINKSFLLIATTISFLSSIYLIYIQMFILQSLCSICLIIDITSIILALIIYYSYLAD